jgi:shikimate dehydrogenase
MPEPTTTVLCGSLSRYPVSLGAAMHRAGYAALGLDYAYVPFRCTDLPGALAGMRALGIRGFGVSMPFKQDIVPLLDELDPLARRIGAVNTVVNDGGTLTGHNTDAAGAIRALREVIEPAGQRVCLLGAGGAARAVAFGLLDAGASVHVANRTEARARALAADLGAVNGTRSGEAASVRPGHVTSGAIGELDTLSGFEILINASSAGMAEYGPGSAVPGHLLHPGLVVMDIVYKPVRTRFLLAASAAGARSIHGGRMLLYQACQQFELYTGAPAPVGAMDRALTMSLDPGAAIIS